MLATTTTDFLSALVIACRSLDYLLGCTKSSQAEAKDIVEAVTEVDNLKDVLSNVCENVDIYHGQWFGEVEKMCQCHRLNVPAQDPSEFY